MKTFDRDYIIANKNCYTVEQLNGYSFMQQEAITLLDIVQSDMPLKDKFWSVLQFVTNIQENQQIVIRCAETVLPFYETTYPENKSPREVLEAAKSCVYGYMSTDDLLLKIAALEAAYGTPYATGEIAADYASTAANLTADYVAYASPTAYAIHYIAANCAIAAADAAGDAAAKEQLLQILIDYCYQA